MRPAAVRVAVAVALLAGAVAAGDLTHRGGAGEVAAASADAPLQGATLVCPDLISVASYGGTRLALSSTGSAHPTGRVLLDRIGTSARPLPLLDRGRRVVAWQDDHVTGAVELSANGTIASGLAAEQFTRLTGGVVRGAADTRCVTPTTDWWFVGASGRVDVHDSLELVNTDALTALVDVQLWGPDGSLRAPNAEGLQVPPAGRVVVHLDRLAPDTDPVALHVVARTGRVAAAVFDQRQHYTTPAGLDWLPPVTDPARQVVVPGLPGGEGTRRLVIADPGERDATVKVRVLGPSGDFVPTGFDALSVPAGRVLPVDVTDVLHGQPATLVVDSDTPVVAAAFAHQRIEGTPYPDIAWTGGAVPLDGPAPVVDNRVHYGNTSTLVLSAPSGDATLTVTSLAPAPPARLRVRVPAGRTVTVDVARVLPKDVRYGGVLVTPDPGSGPVYGTRSIIESGYHGPLSTLLTLLSAPRSVRLPAAHPDLGAGLP